MKKLEVELDIFNQIRLEKACVSSGKSEDEVIVSALESFLSAEGFKNLSTDKDSVAA